MSDEPKSAFEIAMEKLRQRDQERGEEGPAPLSAVQKRDIAAIRRKYEARLAEVEILFQSNRTKALGDPEALQKLEEEYQQERRRAGEEREAEIAAVHREAK